MLLSKIEVDADSESPPEGEGKLSALREAVGVDLPPEFVEFLSATGGRRISRYGFKIGDYTGTFQCPVVYSLHEGFGEYDLIAQSQDAQRHNGVPPQVIPFACCLNGPGDGVLYLDLTGSGGGRVVGYFAAKPAWTGRNTEGAWLDVADSFAGYLEALVEGSPEAE